MPGIRQGQGFCKKVKVKLQKNYVDQIFTGEKKRVEFLTIFEVYVCFLNGILPRLSVNFLVLLSHIPYKNLACLFEVFTGLWLSTPTFCIKDYDYVECFVNVLVLLVINTRCLKNC